MGDVATRGLKSVIARKNAGGGLVPSDLSGYILGLKGSLDTYTDAGTTPATDEGLVYQWSDQSGAANHALQTVSGTRPSLEVTGIDTKDSVDFIRATSQYLESTASGSSTEFVIIAVVRLDILSYNSAILASDTSGGISLQINNSGSVLLVKSGVANMLVTTAGVITAGTDYIIAVSRDSSKNCTIWVNGVTYTGTDAQTITAGKTSQVGGRNSGSDLWDGLISELHSYSAYSSDADVESVMASLNAEYSIY